MRSAIILAGGKSTRMGEDKGLKKLNGRALIEHVIDRVSLQVDEVILVLGSEEQKTAYINQIGDSVSYILDEYAENASLVGALTGLKKARGDYALLTGCDMPFISPEAVSLLFEKAHGRSGATFQWANGWIEPLLAVYHVESASILAEKLYFSKEMRLRMILYRLPDVNMVPMNELRKIDKDLLSFFDADTSDLHKKAEKLIKNGDV